MDEIRDIFVDARRSQLFELILGRKEVEDRR